MQGIGREDQENSSRLRDMKLRKCWNHKAYNPNFLNMQCGICAHQAANL